MEKVNIQKIINNEFKAGEKFIKKWVWAITAHLENNRKRKWQK